MTTTTASTTSTTDQHAPPATAPTTIPTSTNQEALPASAPAKQSTYITTPIYYVNGRPHIGTAYTTVAADVLARAARLQGRDTFFLTGTDEHGLNNARSAEARGLTPQQHVDELSAEFQQVWRRLEISHDRFIRTTEAPHQCAALELWRRLEASGDLYRSIYEGPYCPRCEAYYQEDELLAGNCPIHGQPPEYGREENSFFRLSKYQAALEHLIAETDFVQPVTRRNEVLGVLRQGLRDFSVTRRLRWGIPVPGSPDEVLYVWVDALANYLTGVGFPDDPATFARYWPADVHLVGKDIIRFHCLYWPAFLLSAGLPLPRRVFAHGWLTNRGRKIGKSAGNAVDPLALVERFGSDGLRYCLLRATPFGQDGDFSLDSFTATYNADLANSVGNLVQRATALLARYTGSTVPTPGPTEATESRLLDAAAHLPLAVADAYDRLALDEVIGAISQLVDDANRYAEETAPWSLAKTASTDPAARTRLDTALYHLSEAARLACWHLTPFVPSAATEGHCRLYGTPPQPGQERFGVLQPGSRVVVGGPLFPRLDRSPIRSP